MTLKDYALAGNAIFTVESCQTGLRFTYNIRRPNHEQGTPHFVGVLTSPDNVRGYSFLGTIFEGKKYRHGKKSKITPDAKSATVFQWVWRHIDRLDEIEGVQFHKSGYCCRCGRVLTTPESIKSGIGPVCSNEMGG